MQEEKKEEVKVVERDEQTDKQLEKKMESTPNKNEQEKSRVRKLLDTVGNSNVGEIVKKLAPIINIVNQVFAVVFPIAIRVISYSRMVYKMLPMDIIAAIFGLILTFFGGTFAVSIAAVESKKITKKI